MERRGNGRWVWREEGFKTLTEERFREGLGSERDVVPKGINIFSKIFSKSQEGEEEEEGVFLCGRKEWKLEKQGDGDDKCVEGFMMCVVQSI